MAEFLRELASYAGAADLGALAEELSLVMEGAYVTQQVRHDLRTTASARRVADAILSCHLAPR